MNLRWTDKMFWPAVLGGWSGVVTAAGAAFQIEPFVDIVPSAKIALAVLAAFLFFLMLIDADARRAVDAYNSDARNLRNLTWVESLLPRDVDRRLSILSLVAFVEAMALNIAGLLEGMAPNIADDRELVLLPFLSFVVTALMIMLMLKRRPRTQGASSEPSSKPKRKIGFWIGGDGGD